MTVKDLRKILDELPDDLEIITPYFKTLFNDGRGGQGIWLYREPNINTKYKLWKYKKDYLLESTDLRIWRNEKQGMDTSNLIESRQDIEDNYDDLPWDVNLSGESEENCITRNVMMIK